MSYYIGFYKTRPLTDAVSVYLDGLRVLFCQLVLIGHAASFFGVMQFIKPPYFPWIQSIAVVGFFWLSGFLICHSTLMRKQRKGEYLFSDFFFDRFARIFSAYIPALFFVLLVDFIFISLYPETYGFYSSFSLEAAIKNLFMFQKHPIGLFSAPMFGSASTWWTLGIEWWLYMLFGCLFVVGHAWRRRKVYWVVLLFVAVVPLNYAIKGAGHTGSGLSLIWFVACFFAIIKDAVIQVLNRKMIFISLIFFIFLAVIRYKISMDSYDYMAGMYFGIAFLLSVCWMQNYNKKISEAFQKVIHFVAGYSFTLFLTHYSILYFIAANELLTGWGAFIIAFILSNTVAAASSVCVRNALPLFCKDVEKTLEKFFSKIQQEFC